LLEGNCDAYFLSEDEKRYLLGEGDEDREVVGGGYDGLATELPIFEAGGFPMTTHQATLLTPANTVERLPDSVFVYGSPHQIAILTARPSKTARMTEGDNPAP
jgi:hypothetical protein